MAFEFTRNITDLEKTVSVALAQAGANTPAIDLEQTIGGQLEEIVAQVSVPAVAGLTDAKVLTFALQDSADGTNFTAVDPAISSTAVAAGGTGTPAKDIRFRFPPGTRRYVRIAQTATATAGTFTGSVTFLLLF